MSDSEDEFHGQQKVCVIGDSNTGKTSLIRRYCVEDSCFNEQVSPTAGVDFYIREEIVLQCKDPVKNKNKELRTSLKICDIGGKCSKGTKMLASYLHGANIIILVYDVTNMKSFENLSKWIELAKNQNVGKNIFYAVLGNKNDLEHQRAVRLDKTESFCKKHAIQDYLLSAKSGDGITSAFHDVIAAYHGFQLIEKNLILTQNKIVPSENEESTINAAHQNETNDINNTEHNKKSKISTVCILQ
ncbi:ras-related protein Rab-28-like [Ctenocephalides felis]|uniref:ras-related protein Rab-28-like n=1 Tax=Ctenocephalides felis TaxID=7515 RepID=UPI000E6E1A39|nr:ras-related protein Rab-28-like [Ctenocephalides felis]